MATERETLAEAAAREFGFNPDQPRGIGGKWIHLGQSVTHDVHGRGDVMKKHSLGQVSVRFDKGGLRKVSARSLKPGGSKVGMTNAERGRLADRIDRLTPAKRKKYLDYLEGKDVKS